MFRRILFTTLAVVLAAAGTAGVGLYAKSADTRALKGQEAVKAYVATATVPLGTTAQDAVDNGLIELQTFARKTVPLGTLFKVDSDVRNLVATTDVPAGSLVMRAVFGSKKKSAVGFAIPAGKVAVSIELQDPARVAGLVKVDSKVAVFDTFTVSEGKDAKDQTPTGEGLGTEPEDTHATRVLIPEATVLAIGQTTNGTGKAPVDADKEEGEVSTLVTLAVTQEQAERLITVAQTGAPWFALLSGDSPVTPGPGIDSHHLFTYGESS